MARPATYYIRDRRQLQAVASPARQELIHALMARQPCTVGELAEHMGRVPESLYYHVRKLVEVGLVVEHGRRPTKRRAEAVYRLAARRLRIDPAEHTRATAAALKKLARGVLRHAERLDAAAVDARAPRSGSRREHVLAQRTVRLDAAGLARLNAGIRALLDLLDEEHGGGEVPLFTLTLCLAPNPARGAD